MARADLTIRLNKDEPAHYQGVLIPETTFENMQVDIFASVGLRKNLIECEHDKALIIEKKETSWPVWMIGGLALGLLTSIVLVSSHK